MYGIVKSHADFKILFDVVPVSLLQVHKRKYIDLPIFLFINFLKAKENVLPLFEQQMGGWGGRGKGVTAKILSQHRAALAK